MDIDTVRVIADYAAPVAAIVGVSGMVGWVMNTWLRVKNGYPLESRWGQPIHPRANPNDERVRLLTNENAQLRAELGSVKDRLGNVERIVTDSGFHLTQEIDRLRNDKGIN